LDCPCCVTNALLATRLLYELVNAHHTRASIWKNPRFVPFQMGGTVGLSYEAYSVS
jgi:hypothetical protein